MSNLPKTAQETQDRKEYISETVEHLESLISAFDAKSDAFGAIQAAYDYDENIRLAVRASISLLNEYVDALNMILSATPIKWS